MSECQLPHGFRVGRSGCVLKQRPTSARAPQTQRLTVWLLTVCFHPVFFGQAALCRAQGDAGEYRSPARQRGVSQSEGWNYSSRPLQNRRGESGVAPVVPNHVVAFQAVSASWNPVNHQGIRLRPTRGTNAPGSQGNSNGCRQCLPDLVTVGQSSSPYERIAPWPGDEYICDGGDHSQRVRVRADWTVDGLDIEDTVAHFDTLAGQTIVKPTRRVCIYAPRFAAVRRVSGTSEHRQQEQMNQLILPVKPQLDEELQIASTTLQQLQPNVQLGRQPANIFRKRQLLESVDRPQTIGTLAEGYLAHENFVLMRFGVFDETERLRLKEYSDAAQFWSHDAAVQVVIDETQAMADVSYQTAQTLYQLDRNGKPELCVTKTASRKSALPGDVVDFTLRFDNVGNERIGNVTLIDNLSPRLEYVTESAECSLKADFFTQENAGESLILRWEITQPLEPDQGGLIRFRCKVR